MEDKKSYYAILPANVRYDKKLTPNAKLLYAEITALSNEKGYCWANNKYFADLYSVSTVSISKWIKNLIDCGYITSSFTYKNGTKEILNRYLTLINDPHKENLNTPIKKSLRPSQRKVIDPHKEKFKDNTITINNTINTINISFDEFWDLYDKKVSRDNSEKKWNKLSDKDRELIMQFIPKYKSHQPDKKFRKDPLTFFNNKTWLDEIPNKNGSSVIPENETAEEKDLRIRIESFKKIKVH